MSQALKKLAKEGKAPDQLVQMGKSFSQSKVESELSGTIPESLEEIESQIKKLTQKSWEIFWYLGKRLDFIRKNYLDSLPFTNISEYAKAKFDFSHGTTINCIFISKNFSISHARDFGSKLRLLMPLDEKKRVEYIEWMTSEHPTFRQIEERIQKEKVLTHPVQSIKDININKTKMIVNFKEMGIEIKQDKQDEFIDRLTALIKEYSS